MRRSHSRSTTQADGALFGRWRHGERSHTGPADLDESLNCTRDFDTELGTRAHLSQLLADSEEAFMKLLIATALCTDQIARTLPCSKARASLCHASMMSPCSISTDASKHEQPRVQASNPSHTPPT